MIGFVALVFTLSVITLIVCGVVWAFRSTIADIREWAAKRKAHIQAQAQKETI